MVKYEKDIIKAVFSDYGLTTWIDNATKQHYDYQIERVFRFIKTLEPKPNEYPASRHWEDVHYSQVTYLSNIKNVYEHNDWLIWSPYAVIYIGIGDILTIEAQNSGLMYNRRTGMIGYHEILPITQWVKNRFNNIVPLYLI